MADTGNLNPSCFDRTPVLSNPAIGVIMSGKGRVPKAELSRADRSVQRAAEFVPVTADGVLRGPDLPDTIPWTVQTAKWWLTWRRSPQAQTFTESDWDFLLDTAMLHQEFWSGSLSVAGELRLRVGKFGATPEDRMRLRLQVTAEDAAVKASRPVDSDRKARLVAVVNE
jgi:hypothetical protein